MPDDTMFFLGISYRPKQLPKAFEHLNRQPDCSKLLQVACLPMQGKASDYLQQKSPCGNRNWIIQVLSMFQKKWNYRPTNHLPWHWQDR